MPLLLAVPFVWASAGLGCGSVVQTNTGGGGSGGDTNSSSSSSGAAGAGGDTGGGGAGGDTGGGGAGGDTGGGGTGAGSGLPDCAPHTRTVVACVKPDPAPPDLSKLWAYDGKAIVTAVHPSPGAMCNVDFPYQLGLYEAPETMIDLDLVDGTKVTVGLTVPSLSQGAFAQGDILILKFKTSIEYFSSVKGSLVLEKDGKVVASVGQNEPPPGVTFVEGASECYHEDSLCGRREVATNVDSSKGPVEIKNGETVQVDDLMVTNERYYYNYDTSGGCNFGLSVEYLMSAAAAQ